MMVNLKLTIGREGARGIGEPSQAPPRGLSYPGSRKNTVRCQIGNEAI